MTRDDMEWPPPARGARLAWADVPEAVRERAEWWLQGRVIKAVTQPAGFSPGVAARLVVDNDRRVFVKAIGPEPNAASPEIQRREIKVATALPDAAPVPRLLWSHDEGPGGWVVLALEDIDGRHPTQPCGGGSRQTLCSSCCRRGYHYRGCGGCGGILHLPGRPAPSSWASHTTCIPGRAGYCCKTVGSSTHWSTVRVRIRSTGGARLAVCPAVQALDIANRTSPTSGQVQPTYADVAFVLPYCLNVGGDSRRIPQKKNQMTHV